MAMTGSSGMIMTALSIRSSSASPQLLNLFSRTPWPKEVSETTEEKDLFKVKKSLGFFVEQFVCNTKKSKSTN
uniref:Uncharacterized protein n=1 Tax=Manihot esculenta TaxID=3983 RepID=A0A2C9ULS3_MANES